MISLNKYSKVGILGGTFNPIHMGHLLMAEYVKEAADLDVVMILPNGISYMKAGTNVLPGEVRLKMVELCIEDNPNLITSDMEIKREGNTYTYETLLELKADCPDVEFYFIIGADSLFNIEKWVKPDVIFANCTVVAVGRNQTSRKELEEKKAELEKRYNAKICLYEFPEVEISSTKIRENIKAKKSFRYMVHDKVWNYISKNGLYRE